MPRLIDHARRRQQILTAGFRVAQAEGWEAVSVRSVAARSKLATASVRQAYPEQAALLGELAAAVSTRIAAAILHQARRVATCRTKQEIAAAVAAVIANRELAGAWGLWLELSARQQHADEMRVVEEALSSLTKAFIEAVQRERKAFAGAPVADEDATSTVVIATLRGLVHQRVRSEPELGLMPIRAAVVHMTALVS